MLLTAVMSLRRQFFPIACLASFGLLLVVGCSGLTGPRVSDSERQAYQSALSKLKEDAPATEAELEAFLRAYPDSPLADDAAEQLAKIAFKQGRNDDAFRWLYHIVERYPDGDRIDSARLRLARWEERRGNSEESRQLLERVRVDRLLESERRSFYRLWVQLSEDPAQQLGHLADLRRLLERELEEAGGAAEPSVDQAEPSDLVAKRREDLEAVDSEIDALLHGMSDFDLQRASSSMRARVPAARIRLVLSRRSLDAGDPVLAESLLEQAKRHELSTSDEARVQALEIRLGLADGLSGGEFHLPTFREAAARSRPEVGAALGSVGVVLPLSGRLAPFGQESLRGVLLAARIFDREPGPGSPSEGGTGAAAANEFELGGQTLADTGVDSATDLDLRVVVRDSRGSPDRAAAAVRELAADDDVVAIIGPIFRDESEAAAREAERARIPLLTLSSREEIAAERSHVFRLRTTPDDEVRYLVDYAVDTLGAKSFAVLYPRSRFGRGMRTRYWDAVQERGGQVVAAASYEPDATDFNEPIRSMIGYSLLTRKEKIALSERDSALRRGRRLEPEDAALLRRVLYSQMGPEAEPLPPRVDFDALFIPDSHEKVQLIAPQLAFHEVGRLQLLGSSDWNHPDLVKVGRNHVRGAVISTPFFLGSQFEAIRSFVDGYRESFGRDPDSFSAHAYDAAQLLIMQLGTGNDSRRQIRDGLVRVHGYPGTSGVTSIMPDGNARKRPFLLGVRREGIVGLD